MIIDGKAIADQIQNEIKAQISRQDTRKPCLAVILVGDHPASAIYVKNKAQACNEVGIHSIIRKMPTHITQVDLLAEVQLLNQDPVVDGILIQLPLPPHIDPLVIMRSINPSKDLDGLHPFNVGKMLIGETDGFIPCTPLGIKVLIERMGIETAGKQALVLGRSNLVGKPMMALLMQNASGGNATVTIAHSYTREIASLSKRADIIVAAMGQPKFITVDMVKEGATVIDVGINKMPDSSRKSGYRIVGDVDFENIQNKCSFITPVPGGVGPMTIAMLLSNTFKSYQARIQV